MDPLPRLRCLYVPALFSVNGRLDQPYWCDAQPAELNLYSGRRPACRTVVKAIWNAEELCIAFECEDPEPRATMVRRDDPLFQEGNVVEFFVDPAGQGSTVYEFEINPLGTLMDLFYDRLDRPWKEAVQWNAEGIEAAAQINLHPVAGHPVGWTAELKIPFHNFLTAAQLPPRPGDAWRANFYRYNTLSTLPHDGVELCAWAPTYKKLFNLPHRFGFLDFVGQ
jgi:hypothetical protein